MFDAADRLESAFHLGVDTGGTYTDAVLWSPARGIVVGEAYRVDEDTVAGIPFKPRDRSTWGKCGKAPLLIDPCEGGSTHNIVISGPGGFKSTSAVSSITMPSVIS